MHAWVHKCKYELHFCLGTQGGEREHKHLVGRRQWQILRLKLVSFMTVLIWNKPVFMLIWTGTGLGVFSLLLSIFFILLIKDLFCVLLYKVLSQNPRNSFCSLIVAQKTRITFGLARWLVKLDQENPTGLTELTAAHFLLHCQLSWAGSPFSLFPQ